MIFKFSLHVRVRWQNSVILFFNDRTKVLLSTSRDRRHALSSMSNRWNGRLCYLLQNKMEMTWETWGCSRRCSLSLCLFLVGKVQEHDPLRPDDHWGPQCNVPWDQVGQGQISILAPQAHCRSVMGSLDVDVTIKIMYFNYRFRTVPSLRTTSK